MQQHLSTQQLNNLRIGNSLAAEIAALSPECRAFVVVGAYVPSDKDTSGTKPPKALNSPDQNNLYFWLRRYDVERRYIDNDWEVAESDLLHSLRRRGITSIEALEEELGKYLDDFSHLDVSWRRDNPI